MLTYKCFFKIIRANFSTLVMYTGIFIGMTLLMGVFFGGGIMRFERVSVNIGVVSADSHPISQGLLNYLETMHTLVPLEDDMTALEDAVFFAQVRYVLIVEENFGAEFADSGGGSGRGLRHINAPHNLDLTIYINRQIDSFLQTLSAYLAAGFDYKEAIGLAQQDQLNIAELRHPDEGTAISLYFNSLVYLFNSLIVMTMGFVLLVFREKDLASRLEASPASPKYRTFWLSLACGTTAVAIWALTMIPAHFLHHESLLSLRGLLHMLNALVLVIVCVCIGVLLTRVRNNADGLARIATLNALIAGFTSGMFMPIYSMDDTIRMISRFTPAYWYGNNSRMLIDAVIGQQLYMSEFWLGIGIQLCFAAAFFAMALVIGREKSRGKL